MARSALGDGTPARRPQGGCVIDAALYRAANRFAGRTGWLHAPASAFAKYGVGLFALGLVVGWWIGRREEGMTTLAAVACTVGAVLLALALAQLIGHLVDRARPYDVIGSAHVLVARTKDFSFPSDHATMAGAVAAGLLLADRRLGRVVVGLALVMAFVRVYVGAHYPGDVLAGLLLGATVAVVVHRLGARTTERVLRALVRTPLRPLIARPHVERA